MRRGRSRVRLTVSRWLLLMAAIGVAAVLVASMATPADMGPADDGARAAYLTEHAAILIDSLDDFNAENGVISGDGSAEDPFIIEGLDIGAASAYACVSVSHVEAHVVFRGMYLHEGDCGVSLYRCSNVSFVDCNISGNLWEEVQMRFSHHIAFSNCSILSDPTATASGTVADRCTDLTFTGNRFYGKGIRFDPEDGLFGASPDEEFSSHVITDNLLDGRPVLYYKGQSGVVVDGASAGQVILADCGSASVSDMVVSGGDVAVFAANCPGLSVSDCDLSRSFIGIWVHNSLGCEVTGNEVDGALDIGIWVGGGSNGSLIADNTLTGCSNYSIRAEMCSTTVSGNSVLGGGWGIAVGFYVGPVSVTNNTVSGSGTGIHATHMYQETAVVEGNEVVDCRWGVRVTLSEGAEVSENRLTENTYGVMMEACSNCTVRDNSITDGDYGIYLLDCGGVEVVDNSIDRVDVEAFDNNDGENSWDTEGFPIGMVAVAVAVSLLVVVLLATFLYRRRKAA